MNAIDYINELNAENGSNYKMSVLKKYADDKFLYRLLKMTYDKITYTYGLSIKHWLDSGVFSNLIDANEHISISEALDRMESEIVSRNITGHAAIDFVTKMLLKLDADDRNVLLRVIDRDLKINLGTRSMIKVWSDLIDKPVYMRCDVYGEKTSKNIKFPAYVQLKADGTYREFKVENGEFLARSRSGEEYSYPNYAEIFKNAPDGYYIGELTVKGAENRSIGNGLVNSDDVPYDELLFETWDYVTLDEYKNAKKKIENIIHYQDRFTRLNEIVANLPQTAVIETLEVNSLQEALKFTSEKMKLGLEGAVLKNKKNLIKDGTSKEQLKLKLEIRGEFRVVGFTDGTIGTKREGKIGAIMYESDDGKIKGKTSGFTDVELDNITENKDKFLNQIVTLEFNDLSKGRDNDYYALSHPRFIEIRHDRSDTDTLERIEALRDLAMMLEKI